MSTRNRSSRDPLIFCCRLARRFASSSLAAASFLAASSSAACIFLRVTLPRKSFCRDATWRLGYPRRPQTNNKKVEHTRLGSNQGLWGTSTYVLKAPSSIMAFCFRRCSINPSSVYPQRFTTKLQVFVVMAVVSDCYLNCLLASLEPVLWDTANFSEATELTCLKMGRPLHLARDTYLVSKARESQRGRPH